ncbi:MAG: serine/threonine-protein kinase [Gammaproteobacteria bacterium]|nr:serine/threonine-protein kinase [Gammaproteobacteria bacterium]
MKTTLWRQDWFIILLISLAVLLFSGGVFLQDLERNAYDWGIRNADKTPSKEIAIIAIDKRSLENIGRWPWPRREHADFINLLNSKAQPKLIAYSVLFLEPQTDPGLAHINDLIKQFDNSGLQEYADNNRSTANQNTARSLNNLRVKLSQAQQDLEQDKPFAQALKEANNIVLPTLFDIRPSVNRYNKKLTKSLQQYTLNYQDNDNAIQRGDLPLTAYNAIPLYEPFAQASNGIGHLNIEPDPDGSIRSELLVINYNSKLYPSIALQIAIKALNLKPQDVDVLLGEGVRLGHVRLNINSDMRMLMTFYNQDRFSIDSYYDVISGKINLAKYRNKIILIGSTSSGLGANQLTPIDPTMPPVYLLAHAVSSILQQEYYSTPHWSAALKSALILLVALYLILLVPQVNSRTALWLSFFIGSGFITAHFILMLQYDLWIQLMAPLFLLVIGHLTLLTKLWLRAEKGILRSDAASAESNRMLGLSLQSQGQLDAAFDKFRKCPLDSSLLEILYNLALDFERKRQFNKASELYRYISDFDDGFRDVKSRITRNKAMEDTLILAAAGGTNASLLLNSDNGIAKPKLGRYEIERELGKGAMGAVYLGKDPTISRTVAIKTLALSKEFDGDELVAVKERFFREAETAGRLNHANIVTIYDAGEEHDLAYISMEYLKGHEMSRYTKPDALLPVAKVLELMAQAADALHYAHDNQVVHRDIKPANLMYEPKTDTLKITDFGIARITDSSKTKTGMVLGTPSYMSPEQLSGKKVDGRSDLFSLGIMLYQLLTGKLPFYADSMATLMYKIANEKHPDPLLIRPDLPSCVRRVLNKTLYKDAEQRYSSGNELARDIRACMKQLIIN